jgi:hypothetical protein
MKKILTLMILIASISLFATLDIDIAFDTNVLAEPGADSFTSEYFNITNVGETAEYTIDIEMNDYPEGWFMTWCNQPLPEADINEGCHHHTQPFTFSFPADATFIVDFQVNNMAATPGTIDFEYVITGGDLAEALILPFTFSTENAVNPSPLVIDIGFDTNVTSDASEDAFTSEYFDITNVGETAEYTIDIEMIEYPEGWFMTWCNQPLPEADVNEGCHHHTQPFTFTFPSNSTFTLDFQVNNTAGAEGQVVFEYVITGGDLAEAIILPFTYQTTDYVSNDNSVNPVNTMKLNNYPNPFNPETTISYTLNKSSQVKLEVYNILGQHVATLVDQPQTAGNHAIVWNGKDKNGNKLSSGIYLSKLSSDAQVKMGKMILMK